MGMGGVGDYSGAGTSLTYPKYVLVWGHVIIGIDPPPTKTFGGHTLTQ